MTSFAASANTERSRGTVHEILLDAFECKGDENANGFKTGGAVSCALLNRDDGPEPEAEAARKHATIIFSKEVEEGIEDPESRSFWRSQGGLIMQGLLIFIYMHFDAGLPILQDLYKDWYGKSHDWADSAGTPDKTDPMAKQNDRKLFYYTPYHSKFPRDSMHFHSGTSAPWNSQGLPKLEKNGQVCTSRGMLRHSGRLRVLCNVRDDSRCLCIVCTDEHYCAHIGMVHHVQDQAPRDCMVWYIRHCHRHDRVQHVG